MTEHRLTARAKTANRDVMKGTLYSVLCAICLSAVSGCVQVAAPDKPIEINLNIKIDQNVALRIEGAVNDAIAENAEIF